MKRIIFIPVLLSLLALASCTVGKKAQVARGNADGNTTTVTPPSSKLSSSIDEEIALQKKQMELEDLKLQAEIKKKKNEQTLRELEIKNQQAAQLPEGEQKTIMFCKEESFDTDDYMAGLGIVDNMPDQTRALLDANKVAVLDISTRFIGVIRNGVADYSNNTNTPTSKKAYESTLDGVVSTIGEKAINKYAKVVCRESSKTRLNTWKGYVALHVPLKEAMDNVAEEMEVLGVQFSKEQALKKLKQDLKEYKEQQQEAKKQLMPNPVKENSAKE